MGDVVVVGVLLLLIAIGSVVWWRKVKKRAESIFARIGTEIKWLRWQWEQIRYPSKGNKFVRHPQNTDDMLQKMQRQYGDSDYAAREFATPNLSNREKLQRSMNKAATEKRKKKKTEKESVPTTISENDIPVDMGNHDIEPNSDFDFNAAFNLDTAPENRSSEGR